MDNRSCKPKCSQLDSLMRKGAFSPLLSTPVPDLTFSVTWLRSHVHTCPNCVVVRVWLVGSGSHGHQVWVTCPPHGQGKEEEGTYSELRPEGDMEAEKAQDKERNGGLWLGPLSMVTSQLLPAFSWVNRKWTVCTFQYSPLPAKQQKLLPRNIPNQNQGG